MKNKFVIGFMLIFSLFSFNNAAFGCAMSCAAICRYVCEGTPQSETGCSDADYASSLKRCCDGAFANTPGIEQVPCTVGGGES